MDYKSDLIYPEIKVKEKNIEISKMLLDIYSGRNSILNNIFSYLYQIPFVSNNISEILSNLIEVEINHAKIISKTIYLLGLKPRFMYNNLNNFKYFNTSYINYETNEKKILENNLNLKEELVDIYNKLIDKIEDENVLEILKRILIDENIHIKIFKDLLTY